MKRKFSIKEITLAAALLMTGFSSIAEELSGNSGKSIENETIKIAVIFGITGLGESERTNTYQYEIAKFAIDEVNEKGGVLGKKVEILFFDTQSTGLGSKIAAKKAVDAGVTAVVGPAWSSTALGAAPVLQKAKIPMVATTATNPNVTLIGDYIFRACFIDSFQGKVMANFAINDLEAKSAVILTNVGNQYSTGIAKFFIMNFQKSGGKVLWEGDYSASETDFRLQLEKTKKLNPDVVYVPGYLRDSGFIIKQARKMGISVPFLGGDGWGESMFKYGGDYASGNFFSESWHVDDPREESISFVKHFEKKYGKVMTAPLAYDAVMIVVDAIKRANSTEPQKIQKALAQTKNFKGTTGNITFDENGDPVDKSAVILKLENGTVEYVKTISP